jgi:hypothetical protein
VHSGTAKGSTPGAAPRPICLSGIWPRLSCSGGPEKLPFGRILRENTIKRGGNFEFVSLDFDRGDDRYSNVASDALTPEKVFDARWALTLLNLAMDQVRAEYESRGKIETFDTLKPFLDFEEIEGLPTYEQVAEKLGVGKGAVKTLIYRLRKRHGQILREQVSRTVTEPEEVDDEIRVLCDAVIAAEGLVD